MREDYAIVATARDETYSKEPNRPIQEIHYTTLRCGSTFLLLHHLYGQVDNKITDCNLLEGLFMFT
jgi:hypothetical protein